MYFKYRPSLRCNHDTGKALLRVSAVSAVFCGEPPTADDTTHSSSSPQIDPDPNTGLYPYNAVVKYTCFDGLKFIDGTQTKYVTCSVNGDWSEMDVSCTSKSWSIICI